MNIHGKHYLIEIGIINNQEGSDFVANFTTNYNLQKPFPSEKVDVNVINQNMDVIDTNLKNIADKVDSSSNLKQVVEDHINDK